MTNEQTVPVPLDLLNRLFDNTTLTRDVFAGDSVDVRPSGIGALIDIEALIPTPPKVGDFVTAESVKDLPAGTVLRDNEDDIWLVGPQAIVSYLNPARSDPRVLAVDDPAWGMYEPVIISLPRD